MASVWLLILYIIIYFQVSVNEIEGKKGFGDGEQDWGYVNVRSCAHMFWWLYYADPSINSTNFNVSNKPLLIWLQEGSRNSASGFGNFASIGPLDANLRKRNFSLIKDYNVLFIDNPVGVGFSYVENNSQYARTNTEMASDLLKVIQSFFNKNPQFQNTSTYIIGQSYGSRVAVELALQWHLAYKLRNIDNELKGVAVGNPWISPIDSVSSWATYLQLMGIIEEKDYIIINQRVEVLKNAINSKRWCQGYHLSRILRGFINHRLNNTFDAFNILTLKNARKSTIKYSSRGLWNNREISPNITNFNDYNLMNNVKNALQLKSSWVKFSANVTKSIRCDLMKPVISPIERLLNETKLKVFVYNGLLDSVTTVRGTFEWVEKLQWKSAEKWNNSTQVPLLVNNVVEGFVKEYQNLKLFTILRAGHHVPIENPFAMKAILQDLTLI